LSVLTNYRSKVPGEDFVAKKLSNDSLASLPQGVAGPAYDRAGVKPGILHIGLGNFHRAHQAVYCDDLLRGGGDPDWGIVGAGVMPGDAAMRKDLVAQDCLFSVTEMSAASDSVRVIGAMSDFLPVEAGHGAILKAMASPSIRIVSLTVTEGGYFVSTDTGGFTPDHPSIRADIVNPDMPTTVFGAIAAGLRARRDVGEKPFTVMSCDNLPHNGSVTRATVTGVACEQDPDLARWIEENVAFPNGMVDRITPATTNERREHLARHYGLDDARPVFCEPFRQWVLEDSFSAGRPEFENVGVQFVSDVTPYEHMKIRMLNGGHAIIAYPAGLIGLTYAHEAMTHPRISAFFDKLEREEVYPVVTPVPGMSHESYHALLRQRFANPRIEDTIRRLCFDGSNRQPKFIVPTIFENLGAGRPIDGMALESALWCRYCYGETEAGTPIEPNDPDWERLSMLSKRARADPQIWLAMREVYGDLANNPLFAKQFGTWLNRLWRDGTVKTIETYLDGMG
jgi:mannitol 2-dehydrogenase